MGDIEVCRVSLVHATPTHLSAEGNVSETLQAMVTNSAIPTHRLREINKFLEETFSLLGFLLLLSTSSKLSVPVLIFSHVLILALAL